MCGIAGALSARPPHPGQVERMRDELGHRGPDHAGLWHSDDGRVVLGHRRLAIIDLSADANQPLDSGDGRLVVTFNGEIYNHARLRRELEALGVGFRTRSDTEVLLRAFDHWGEGCLARLEGMFAFALWDGTQQRLFCARDRAGEKPFHYATVGDTFVFASELKALVTWPGFRRAVSQTAIADFLRLGCVPDPKTIWEDCHKLEPGHAMSVTLDDRGPSVETPAAWWDMTFEPDRSVSDWGPEIRATLSEAAADMALAADVPVGTFLSGGVDSSSVVAALARAGRPVRTFTIGFDEAGYDERPWARDVATRYATRHTERTVDAGDVTPVLDRLHHQFDEPFGDHSYLPTFYVCREARRDVTVALSGDGGDEAFGGYTKYRRLALRSALEPLIPAAVGGRIAQAGTLLREPSRARTLLTQYGQGADELLTTTMLTGLAGPTLAAAARGPLRAALAEYRTEDAVTSVLRRAPAEEVGLVNAMRYLDLKLTLGAGILTKVDRASMAVSLEVRPVYLHPRVLELAGRIPPERLATRGVAKKALKEGLRPWLDDELLYRPKAGFAMPLRSWMRGELSGLGGYAHGSDGLAEIIDPRFVDDLGRAHAAGRVDASSALHAFMFLGQWFERWL